MMKTPQIPPSGAAKKPAPAVPAPAAPAPAKTEKPVGLPQAVSEGELFEEDFTDTKGGFAMVDPGLHHAKVIDFERSESKGGNPQYVWQFRITAGDSKDTEIRYWTSLLPQARWKTAETLDAIGIVAAGSIARFTKKDVLGRPCIIEVIHDTYDGKLNHKVQKVHPPNKDSVELANNDKTPF
jgi:hypothetical protein